MRMNVVIENDTPKIVIKQINPTIQFDDSNDGTENYYEDVNKAICGNQKSYSNLYAYLAPILRKTIKRKIYGVPSHLANDIYKIFL